MNETETKFAKKVVDELESGASDDMPQAQAGEFLSIIVDLLLPIFLEWLEGCNEDADSVIKRANAPRTQSIILNWKIRQEIGRKDWKMLGGRKMSAAILKVAADDSNAPLVQSLMRSQ